MSGQYESMRDPVGAAMDVAAEEHEKVVTLEAELERERGLREAAEREVARLSKLEQEVWTSPEKWMQWCDIRVLEQYEAERGRAEVATATLRALEAALQEIEKGTVYVPSDCPSPEVAPVTHALIASIWRTARDALQSRRAWAGEPAAQGCVACAAMHVFHVGEAQHSG